MFVPLNFFNPKHILPSTNLNSSMSNLLLFIDSEDMPTQSTNYIIIFAFIFAVLYTFKDRFFKKNKNNNKHIALMTILGTLMFIFLYNRL